MDTSVRERESRKRGVAAEADNVVAIWVRARLFTRPTGPPRHAIRELLIQSKLRRPMGRGDSRYVRKVGVPASITCQHRRVCNHMRCQPRRLRDIGWADGGSSPLHRQSGVNRWCLRWVTIPLDPKVASNYSVAHERYLQSDTVSTEKENRRPLARTAATMRRNQTGGVSDAEGFESREIGLR